MCCTGTPDAPAGAFDQSELEVRQDVLVYTTPVLEKGVEVTGPVELVLHVSSTGRDTDFTGKLVDVYPDGRAFNVQEGILRARYREGLDKQVWLDPAEVYRLEISLHATSNYFAPGHRIRLEVSSSNFPRFDRNLNTGGKNYDEAEWKIVDNVVYHSSEYPSYLVLPVVD
jgi:putative CocE/NonD family hydrolase